MTTEAVERATEVFRREIHSLRETIETRMAGSDEDRGRIWERLRDLPALYETFTVHLREEMFRQDAHDREVLTQRLEDLDGERALAAARTGEELEHRRREFLDGLKSVRELLEQRFAGMDQALELMAGETSRALTAADSGDERTRAEAHSSVAALRELIETRLTGMDKATELLAADLRAVPSSLDERIRGLHELIGERLDAMDRATDLRLRVADQLPGTVTERIDQLRKLHEERFSSIAQQFQERDVRTNQAQQASDQALNAALQAAKELVNAQGEASSAAAVKSETSFTKQIDQIGTIISTLEKALDARITELKERIDRGEGSNSGQLSVTGSPFDAAAVAQEARIAQDARQRAAMAIVISAILALVALSSLIFAIVKK